MRESLRRAVGVGPGEGGIALALVLVMLGTALGAGAGATAMDALLFARLGTASLPQLYLALGVVSFVCALGVAIVFGAARREHVYQVVLAVLAVALVGLRLLVATLSAAVYPIAWLGTNVVVVLQGIVAWGVASWLCDARQAIRLFPVANAAKIGGAIVGSALVAPLLAILRLEDLLVLWSLTLAGSLSRGRCRPCSRPRCHSAHGLARRGGAAPRSLRFDRRR